MCLTCSIVKEEQVPVGGVIYRDQHVIVHHCINVNVPGYVIVSPVRHVEGYRNLDANELMSLSLMLKKLDGVLQRIPGVEKVYIVSLAEETSHFHFHVFPRYSWMLDRCNTELFTNNKLDGAKLFSFYRCKQKTDKLATISQIAEVVAYIKKQLGSNY